MPAFHSKLADTLSGCPDLTILRLPHRVLHLLNDVAEFDAGQAFRHRGFGTTATATVADTLRKSSTCGSSDAPGWRTVTRLDTAFAAAANMPSLIRRARDTMAPRPRPGYSMALFTWAMT